MMHSLKFSRNQLKMLAMLTMTLNHIALIFGISGIPGEVLIGIGYFTAPCMCYFLVEGYYHTRSVGRYALRLFVLAVISQLPYNLAFGAGLYDFSTFNMMFTLLLSLMICVVYDKMQDAKLLLLRRLLFAGLIFLCCFCDWYYLAPVMVLLLLLKRDGRMSEKKAYLLMAIVYAFSIFMNAWMEAAPYTGAGENAPITILYACLFLIFYMIGPCMLTWALKHYDSAVVNHGPGWLKWFFYFYYPVHILALHFIAAM